MKFLLLTKYAEIEGLAPSSEWDPVEVTAHMDHLNAVNKELVDSGELVEVVILGGPDLATIVTFSGTGAPVCTDGPFPESKELLAGGGTDVAATGTRASKAPISRRTFAWMKCSTMNERNGTTPPAAIAMNWVKGHRMRLQSLKSAKG